MKTNVRYKFAWLGNIVIVSFMTMPVASAKSPKYISAQVRFMATSTSTRSSFGENQDVYLIEVKPRDGSDPQLARLEDIYPRYRDGLSEAVLKSPGWDHLKLIRDHSCDTAFGAMPLRTAPGDPAALLLERLGFHPRLPVKPPLNEVLPCFRTVR